MVDVNESPQRHFGHASFRRGQEALVRAVVEGHDVLAVMPAGSGKSLGFQHPPERPSRVWRDGETPPAAAAGGRSSGAGLHGDAAGAETAAAVLQAAGVQGAEYHGGMPDAARTPVQEAFASGALRVVCATSAFGMGNYGVPGARAAWRSRRRPHCKSVQQWHR